MSDRSAELLEELIALAEGRGATARAVALQQTLVTLPVVIAHAPQDNNVTASESVAHTAIYFLVTAADALETDPEREVQGNRSLAARTALGLAPGTQDKPLRGRRNAEGRLGRIAAHLGIEPATLTKTRVVGSNPLIQLLTDVVEELLRIDVAYQISEKQRTERQRRSPSESALQLDWYALFCSYYSMYTPLASMASDLRLASAAQRHSKDEDTSYYTNKSMYYLAVYFLMLKDFIATHGGLWVTPDAPIEQRIADLSWLAWDPTPFSEVDQCNLRLTLVANRDLTLFLAAARNDHVASELAERWSDWLRGCRCRNDKRPAARCDVHKVIGMCDEFCALLDGQWDEVSDWYLRPRPPSDVDIAIQRRLSRSD
jgi:hypothetical protein